MYRVYFYNATVISFLLLLFKQREAERQGRVGITNSSNTSNGPPRTNKRQIDEFMVEIKSKQQGGGADLHSNNSVSARSGFTNNDNGYDDYSTTGGVASFHTAAADERGSFDNGDPNTTNLYIGNLSPSTTG